MSESFPSALATSRIVVRALIVLNWVVASLIGLMFILSVVAREFLFTALGVPFAHGRLIVGMRLIMLVGIASAPLAHILLTNLLAIIETVRDGDPFVTANASRLQNTAWALLGLELLHLAVGASMAFASSGSQKFDMHWDFSITGWVAVLLLFVLARVFDQGTRMRDDLEGTV